MKGYNYPGESPTKFSLKKLGEGIEKVAKKVNKFRKSETGKLFSGAMSIVGGGLKTGGELLASNQEKITLGSFNPKEEDQA